MFSLMEFKNYMERKSYSFNTKKMYMLNVKSFLEILKEKKLDPCTIKAPDMFRLVDHISSGRTKRSTNTYLSAVSGFYNYLLSYGYIDVIPISKGHFLKEDREEKKPLSPLEQEIFKAYILNKEDKQKHSFLLMLYGGLRVSEIATVKNVKFKNNILKFVCLGKGNKKRTVFIDDYPEVESLLEFFKNGNSLDLSPATLKNSINLAQRKLSIKLTCHTLRHTYATNKASKGMPISVLQTLMGHNNISVTAKYIHLQDETILNYFENKD